MNFLSMCSGIEAASVAWAPLGWKAVAFAEIDKFASAVLAHHYPDVPNLGDMTTIARRVLTGEVPAADVLCGGTPCQAFSVAGLRESLADERGNLSLKFIEIADAIDLVRTKRGQRATTIVWENVPGVLSTKDNAFGCFLARLAGEDEPLVPPGQNPKPGQPWKWANAGAVYGPARAVAWRTLDAQYFGLAQRRRRVFVVASAAPGFDPARVLFEWQGLRRDTAPSRSAGQNAVAGTLRSTDGGSDVTHACAEHLIAHTLRAEGFDASEDGTGRGTPLVPVAARSADVICMARGQANAEVRTDGGATALTCLHEAPIIAPAVLPFDTTHITSPDNVSNPKPGAPCHALQAGAHPPAIAFSCKDYGADAGAVSPTLRAMGHAGSHANAGGQVAVAFHGSQDPCVTGSVTPSVGRNQGQETCAMVPAGVRRLMPLECERLQGFPDDYTRIPWRTYQEAARKGISYETLLARRGMTLRGPSIEDCPDGPRYKALGNSWAVPCARWIGQRIAAHIDELEHAE